MSEGGGPETNYQVIEPLANSRHRNSIIESMSVTSSPAFRRDEKWHASLWHTLTLRSYSWIRSAKLNLVAPNRGTPFLMSFI